MVDGRVASQPGAIAYGDGAASVSAHSGDAPSRDLDWHGNPVADFASWVYGEIAELHRQYPYCDSDEHRNGEDPQGLSGEAMPARVREGIAQDQSGDPQ